MNKTNNGYCGVNQLDHRTSLYMLLNFTVLCTWFNKAFEFIFNGNFCISIFILHKHLDEHQIH